MDQSSGAKACSGLNLFGGTQMFKTWLGRSIFSCVVAVFCMGFTVAAWAQAGAAGAIGGHMVQMPGHMHMTELRPVRASDQQKADAIVAAAKQAMAPYQDYRKALADGYEIFLPDVPQAQYHFTKYEYGLAAWRRFDPLKPTSLLYKKTADGGYKLVGAMYTDRVEANEDELNSRIP